MENSEIVQIISSTFASTFRLSIPLLFAALGGLFSERSGVTQIALEGLMLVGALFAAIAAYKTGFPWVGLGCGILASTILALIKGFFVLQLKADQIVVGTALNIFVFGFAPLLTKAAFDSTGQTPAVLIYPAFHTGFILVGLFLLLIIFYIYYQTRAGLWLRFSGEAPTALLVAGKSPKQIRYWSLMSCGALAGFSGASLSLYLSSSYSPMMTAGRGFIALAALIFGRWKPLPTLFICLMFGFTDALQIQLQGAETHIPAQFIQMIPYLLTIVALAGLLGKSQAPKALGQN